MSENSGAGQTPDPDPVRNPDSNPGSNPDSNPDKGSTLNDPTAPVWADPTALIPAPPSPPAPPGARPQDDRPETSPYATPQPPPQGTHAASNPYAQQQPVQPYGQQPADPGQQHQGYGQAVYATGPQPEANTSAIVLTVLSGLSLVVGNILAIASLILGIVGLSKNTTDREGSRRLTKIGWIVFAVSWAIGILVVIGVILWLAFTLRNGDNPSNTGF